MTIDPLVAVGVVAAVVALVALGGGQAALARRRRASEAARRESERVAMGRLAWLTGRSEVAPEVAPLPSPFARAAVLPAAEWVVSPRRRLGRDTSAVLLVGTLGILVVAVAWHPAPADSGVLGATATPRPVAPATATPTATPTPTLSPTPAATARPTAKPTPRPTPLPAPPPVVVPPPAAATSAP